MTDTDYWFFMWTSTSGGTVTFPNVTGNPMDNVNLAAILNGKADIDDVPTKTYVDNADGNLQTQIDALASRSDVVDVVATYAALQAYDTTTLIDNDVIKVLADETHSGA